MITLTNEGWKKDEIEQLCYRMQGEVLCGHWCPMLKITETDVKVCCGQGVVVEYKWTKDEREKP